jgi:hypothetical protein
VFSFRMPSIHTVDFHAYPEARIKNSLSTPLFPARGGAQVNPQARRKGRK